MLASLCLCLLRAQCISCPYNHWLGEKFQRFPHGDVLGVSAFGYQLSIAVQWSVLVKCDSVVHVMPDSVVHLMIEAASLFADHRLASV